MKDSTAEKFTCRFLVRYRNSVCRNIQSYCVHFGEQFTSHNIGCRRVRPHVYVRDGSEPGWTPLGADSETFALRHYSCPCYKS